MFAVVSVRKTIDHSTKDLYYSVAWRWFANRRSANGFARHIASLGYNSPTIKDAQTVAFDTYSDNVVHREINALVASAMQGKVHEAIVVSAN